MKNVSNLDISAVIPVFPIKKGYLTLKTFSGKNQNYVFVYNLRFLRYFKFSLWLYFCWLKWQKVVLRYDGKYVCEKYPNTLFKCIKFWLCVLFFEVNYINAYNVTKNEYLEKYFARTVPAF